MLFNSYAFIFIFLPVVLTGTFCLSYYDVRSAKFWLCAASIIFYGLWSWLYACLLISSIIFNYCAAQCITRLRQRKMLARWNSFALGTAVAINLGVLAYFKYTNFFISVSNDLLNTSLSTQSILLPLGISFFTFTQIAYLIDIHNGDVRNSNAENYFLLVTYFPHQIAGPILHHKQIIPQFEENSNWKPNTLNLAAGLTLFTIGLAKKVLIADNLSEYATPVFEAVKSGHTLMLIESWVGSLAYSLQLYFDFSGYSDMAIGLSLMLNIILPENFNSPYKATSIIDFWRRWHITLSVFLRNYIYIPLGGSRKGSTIRHVNLFITMLLGGLWHGAGWTFLIWGGLHGIYLIVNHGWRAMCSRLGWTSSGPMRKLTGQALTFLCVIVGWVVFRSDTTASSLAILSSMVGANGVSLPGAFQDALPSPLITKCWINVQFLGLLPVTQMGAASALISLLFGLAIVLLMPNSREFLSFCKPTYEDQSSILFDTPFRTNPWLRWSPSALNALVFGSLFSYATLSIVRGSHFLYFQF